MSGELENTKQEVNGHQMLWNWDLLKTNIFEFSKFIKPFEIFWNVQLVMVVAYTYFICSSAKFLDVVMPPLFVYG